MVVLERYEWCDFWWDDTGATGVPRVLPVGDSITRSYRRPLTQLFQGRALVDMLATSRAVDNPALLHELEYMLGPHSLPHQLIHLNNGLHGLHLSAEAYLDGMRRVVDFIAERQPGARLVLALTTPVGKQGDPRTPDEEKNPVVIERNEMVRLLAAERNLPVNDLYTPMLANPGYRSADGVHYNAEGQQALAELVAAFLSRELAAL